MQEKTDKGDMGKQWPKEEKPEKQGSDAGKKGGSGDVDREDDKVGSPES